MWEVLMMIIKSFKGYELEKEKPNTSEDYFNRSELIYEENGIEKNLHVLYVRFYEENFQQYTSFKDNPVFKLNDTDIYIRDFIALICLLKNPGLRHRKRVYINTEKEFRHYFEDIDFQKVKDLLVDIKNNGKAEVKSPLHFLTQSS